MKRYIFCLARVFSKEQYALDFLSKGKFRCNTLRFFKDYKEEELNNIGDVNEGILFNMTRDSGAKLKVRPQGTEEWMELDFQHLRYHSNSVLTNNVFCMYAPNLGVDEKYSVEEIEQIVKIQEEAEKLGEYLVLIIKPEIFFKRLQMEVVHKRKYLLRRGLIEYVNLQNSFNLNLDNPGFYKSDEYAHQKEYRIMIDDGKNEDLHMDLEIGSLDDIAFMIPTGDFNSSIKVSSKEELTEE